MSPVFVAETHSTQTASSRIQAKYQALIPGLGAYGPYGRVYPINQHKNPLITNFDTDTADPDDRETIRHWLSIHDCSGLGLRIESPRFVIVDCEHPFKHGADHPGADGIAEFERFCQSHGVKTSDHFTVCSATRGFHHAFLLPADLLTDGIYLQDGKTLPGIDLLSFGKNVILPGSRVEVEHGTGEYTIVSGLGAGIKEMPRAFAFALAEKMIPCDIESLGNKKKRLFRKESASIDRADLSRLAAAGEPAENEVLAAVERMQKCNPHFRRLWENQPSKAGKDDTRSGQLRNIAKVSCGFDYSEQMARAIARLWCTRHGREFPKAWQAIYQSAVRSYEMDQEKKARVTEEREKEEGKKVVTTQVHKHPPNFAPPPRLLEQHTAGLRSPEAKQPNESKQLAFKNNKRASASLARNRPDLDKKHSDDPESGNWQLTRSYLLSVTYGAFRAGCQEEEVMWYVAQFMRKSAPPEFDLTPQRLQTIMDRALDRVKGTETRVRLREWRALSGPVQKKPRKERSDKGTSKRLRQVARQMQQGLKGRQIARNLKINYYTARNYCRQVWERGGIDAVLRPKKRKTVVFSFGSSLAEIVFENRRQFGYQILHETANWVIQETRAYAEQAGRGGMLTELMVRNALLRSTAKSKSKLIQDLQMPIANSVAESNRLVLILAKRIRACGLPGKRDSKEIRQRYGFPKAVLHAVKAVRTLAGCLHSEEDIESLWDYSERIRNFWRAVDETQWEQMKCEYELELARTADTSASSSTDQKAIEINPKYERAYINCGNVLQAQGKNEEAEKLFKKVAFSFNDANPSKLSH